MRSTGVSVFVAEADVSARYPLTGPAVVCVAGGPPFSTTPSVRFALGAAGEATIAGLLDLGFSVRLRFGYTDTGGSRIGGVTVRSGIRSAGTSCAEIGLICPAAINVAKAIRRAARKKMRAPRRSKTI
jgi:hypothetical protein